MMRDFWTPHPWRGAGRLVPIASCLLALLAAAGPARLEAVEAAKPGQLWLLRQYRVPGCEPMPRLPTVFNWLIRKALAVEEFIATSADCGQTGRRGAREGWTYVFWSEGEDTAVARLLKRGEERFGITRLVARKPEESYSVHSRGYEPFVMIQLGGDQGPVRIWATGDVAELSAEISMGGSPGEFEVGVESVTHEGQRCRGRRLLQPEEPPASREAVPCVAGG